MLTLGLYAIIDKAASAFFNPFVARKTAEAHRSFGDTVKDPQGNLSKHPEHFDLYQIGTFDPVSGEITPLKKIELVARATDFVDLKEN